MTSYLPDVPLANENAGVVNALGKPAFEYLGLEMTLQEVFDLNGQQLICVYIVASQCNQEVGHRILLPCTGVRLLHRYLPSLMRVSSSTPILTSLRIKALPSKSRFGSLSSSLSSS